jgi:hypothetical protein
VLMTILLVDHNLLANQSWSALMSLSLEDIMVTRKVYPLLEYLLRLVHLRYVIYIFDSPLARKGIHCYILRKNILDV